MRSRRLLKGGGRQLKLTVRHTTSGVSCHMHDTVFVELQFWLLVVFSFVVPGIIVWVCLTIRAVSRNAVLALGLLLVAIAGFDFYLLQAGADGALNSLSGG